MAGRQSNKHKKKNMEPISNIRGGAIKGRNECIKKDGDMIEKKKSETRSGRKVPWQVGNGGSK